MTPSVWRANVLYTPEEIQNIRERKNQILNRIKERGKQIKDSEGLQALPERSSDVVAKAQEQARQISELVGENVDVTPGDDEGGAA
jgi:hypothetical protein